MIDDLDERISPECRRSKQNGYKRRFHSTASFDLPARMLLSFWLGIGEQGGGFRNVWLKYASER